MITKDTTTTTTTTATTTTTNTSERHLIEVYVHFLKCLMQRGGVRVGLTLISRGYAALTQLAAAG